jgi:hypothetical protein
MSTILLLIISLLSLSSNAIDTRTHVRAVNKGHTSGQGKGKGKGKGQTNIEQTASNIINARTLATQKEQARLSIQTEAQAWSKARAQSMAKAQASMIAQEHAALQVDAQMHARTEASVYVQMDQELHLAQTAASANTPSLILNPRLKKRTKKVKKTKEQSLLEEMMSPLEVQQKQMEEKKKRKERRLAKMPKPDEIKPFSMPSFIEIHAASSPAWWPHAAVNDKKHASAIPSQQQSMSDIVSKLFDTDLFRKATNPLPRKVPVMPSSSSSSSHRNVGGNGHGLFHHQHPFNFLQQQQAQQQQQQLQQQPPPRKKQTYDQQLRDDAMAQFQSMVDQDKTKSDASNQRNAELQSTTSNTASSNANVPPPSLFGEGGPGENLSSGGNPFAGSMPPPSGVKYSYTPMSGSTNGKENRPPPPPPPGAAVPPSPMGTAPTTTAGGAARENQMHLSSPQPVNPDSLVDKQFLPSSGGGGGGSSADSSLSSGGIAQYETSPLSR